MLIIRLWSLGLAVGAVMIVDPMFMGRFVVSYKLMSIKDFFDATF
jgi:hypothetical protein